MVRAIDFTRRAKQFYESRSSSEKLEITDKLVYLMRHGSYVPEALPFGGDGLRVVSTTSHFIIVHRFEGDTLKVADLDLSRSFG